MYLTIYLRNHIFFFVFEGIKGLRKFRHCRLNKDSSLLNIAAVCLRLFGNYIKIRVVITMREKFACVDFQYINLLRFDEK